jgi:hypothetical protein
MGIVADNRMTAWANKGILPKPGIDKHFDVIRAAIESKRWIPVAAQWPVGCDTLRLATKIDLVVSDLNGTLYIVELKCGFRDYFELENQGNMRYPFQNVPVSAKNNSFLQLFVTEYLFTHCAHKFSGKPYGGAFLLRVCDGEYSLDPLPAWCTGSIQTCIGELYLTRDENTQTRKRSVKNGVRRARTKRRLS